MSDLDDWGFGQVKKSKKNPRNGQVDWDPKETAEKASYDDEDRFFEPEAATEYDPSAGDMEPSLACDIPTLDAKEEPMSEKLGEYEAATITAEEEEELAALTFKKAKRGKLKPIPEKPDWGYTRDYVALAKPPADETLKEDKSWPEEENAAAEAEPIEDAKPVDDAPEEEHEEPKPDDYIQKEQKIAKLPFSSPYRLTAYLQQVLEQACFAYGRKNWPELLRKNNWDCVEAVSLTTWVKELEDTLDTQPSRGLLQSIAEVQAIAVERRPVDWPMMKKFFDDAVELTEILNVKEYGEIIVQIQLDIGKTMKSLSRDEEEAQSQEEKKLQWIAEERRKLDEREAEVRK
ncbi:hypothetical protein FOXYS1_14109, partial [Fusarium oxysporum]